MITSGRSAQPSCELASLHRSTSDYAVKEDPEELVIRKRLREVALQLPTLELARQRPMLSPCEYAIRNNPKL